MQAAWLAAVAADESRLSMRFGTPVKGVKAVSEGVEIDAEIVEHFDLAVIAEGGVFADQPKLSWPEGVSRDYRQKAWIGQVLLSDDTPAGVAYERFTPSGPAALLPLPKGSVMPGGPVGPRAALVWCVPSDDDPVAELNDSQRLTVLNTIFPAQVGEIRQMSPLKVFPLGLNAHRRLVSEGALVRIGNAAHADDGNAHRAMALVHHPYGDRSDGGTAEAPHAVGEFRLARLDVDRQRKERVHERYRVRAGVFALPRK